MTPERPASACSQFLACALVLLCTIGAASSLAQDQPEFLAEQPAAVIDATEYVQLEILGLAGAVSVRAGLPGDLRYGCRDLATRREERPVALWQDGRTLIIGPGQETAGERLLCEAVVPPNLSVVVELDEGKVVVNNLANTIEISGFDVDVEARALTASMQLDLSGGKTRIYGIVGDLEIQGKNVNLEAQDLDGNVSLVLEGGKADLEKISGDLDLDLTAANVAIEGLDGMLDVAAEGGDLTLATLRAGGTIVVSGTRLALVGSKGLFDIDTNADAEIRDMHGDLRLRCDGGKVAILGSAQNVEVDGIETELTLERIAGKTTVLGDALKLQIRELGGELSVSTSGSQVVVAGVNGPVNVINDFGDVVIAKAAQAVSVRNSQGSVRVTQLAGPATIDAEGPEVTVHFTDTSHNKNSVIENKSGNMTLMFSQKGGGRLDAKSVDGTVQGNLPGIDFSEDGKTASGTVNRMPRPAVKATSVGNLYLNVGPRAGNPDARPDSDGASPDTQRRRPSGR